VDCLTDFADVICVNRSFTGRFIANEMLLLKRPVGEMKNKTVKRFDFQNLPVITKQGELFG
jgi:hypothetical protein